jgi:hypothetical protein
MLMGLTAPGGSMTFYDPTWHPDKVYNSPSGVQTDYFRLKARGIYTLPNGAPLASSAAVDLRRSLDSKEATPEAEEAANPKRTNFVTPKSKVFSGILSRTSQPRLDSNGEDDVAVVARAREIMRQHREEVGKKRRWSDLEDGEEAQSRESTGISDTRKRNGNILR